MKLDVGETNQAVGDSLAILKEMMDKIQADPMEPLGDMQVKAFMTVACSAMMGLHMLVNQEAYISRN